MTLAGLVAEVLSIQYEKRLLIFDTEGFSHAQNKRHFTAYAEKFKEEYGYEQCR